MMSYFLTVLNELLMEIEVRLSQGHSVGYLEEPALVLADQFGDHEGELFSRVMEVFIKADFKKTLNETIISIHEVMYLINKRRDLVEKV